MSRFAALERRPGRAIATIMLVSALVRFLAALAVRGPVYFRDEYLYTAIASLFALANSSDAFIVLRAQNVGGSTLVVLALMAAFNLVYAALSRPFVLAVSKSLSFLKA